MKKNIYKIENEVYITSDEQIKEGDWFIHSSHGINTLLKAINITIDLITDNEGMSCKTSYCKKNHPNNRPNFNKTWCTSY